MNVVYKYGRSNDKSKDFQPIYLRCYHNKLETEFSLGIDIPRELWDFGDKKKKKPSKLKSTSEILPPEYRPLLLKVTDITENITRTISAEFGQLRIQYLGKKVQDVLTSHQWKEFVLRAVEKAQGGEPVEKFLLIDKMEEYLESESLRGMAESTQRTWRTRINTLRKFEQFKGRQYYTDEIDQKWWDETMKWVLSQGNSGAYHGEHIKKVVAVFNHFIGLDPNFPHNPQIKNRKKFKITKSKKQTSFLTPEELKLIIDYSGDRERLKNISKIATILYYGCIRYSEFELAFKDNTPKFREVKGRNYKYRWTIKQQKTSNQEEDSFKTIPVHKLIEEMYDSDNFPRFITAQQFNKGIKELCNERGITKVIKSHDFRRSFITNMDHAGYSRRDIMDYSGQKKEETVVGYIVDSGRDRDNSIPTV